MANEITFLSRRAYAGSTLALTGPPAKPSVSRVLAKVPVLAVVRAWKVFSLPAGLLPIFLDAVSDTNFPWNVESPFPFLLLHIHSFMVLIIDCPLLFIRRELECNGVEGGYRLSRFPARRSEKNRGRSNRS